MRGIHLKGAELYPVGKHQVVVAELSGMRELHAPEIGELKQKSSGSAGTGEHCAVRTSGPTLFTEELRLAIQDHLSAELAAPAEVFIHTQLEAVFGPHGYTTLDQLLTDFRRRNLAEYGDKFRQSILETR